VNGSNNFNGSASSNNNSSYCGINLNNDNNNKMKTKYANLFRNNNGMMKTSYETNNSFKSTQYGDGNDSHYDDDEEDDDNHLTYPKEKFYGNAKLLLSMNDEEVLRKRVFDYNDICDDNFYNYYANDKSNAKNQYRDRLRQHKSINQQQINEGSSYKQFQMFTSNHSMRKHEKRKCKSTSMLNVLPTTFEIESTMEDEDEEARVRMRKGSFVSALSKKTVFVRNSKSC
jgi:hypothetical protein